MTSAVSEIGELFKGVSFEDKAKKTAAVLCAIIVKGKPSGYCFSADNELSGYYAAALGEKEIKKLRREHDCRSNFYMDQLVKNLLERAGLLQISGGMPDGIFLKPTQKAFDVYEQLKSEGSIDENGFLEGDDCGFC